MAKGSIRARIQCSIEIPVGTWSGGTAVDLDALTKQVKREGRNIVANLVKEAGGAVIGEPKVFFVVLDEPKD
jgi:hypothetical protein